MVEFDATFKNVVTASVAKKRQLLETNNVYNTTEIDNIVRTNLSLRNNLNDLID
jgi:hypothetical protein